MAPHFEDEAWDKQKTRPNSHHKSHEYFIHKINQDPTFNENYPYFNGYNSQDFASCWGLAYMGGTWDNVKWPRRQCGVLEQFSLIAINDLITKEPSASSRSLVIREIFA